MRDPEIYLVRHGETHWNRAGRFQGKLDSPLTDKGIRQAEDCGRRLAEIADRIDGLQVSPLGRARQTGDIIQTFCHIPDERVDPRLREVSIGSWDGLTHVDIDAQWPGQLAGTTPFNWYFKAPDGESYAAAAARAGAWLAGVTGVVVAISHGLLGRVVRGIYLGLPEEDALGLPVPPDVIWRLAGGSVTPF